MRRLFVLTLLLIGCRREREHLPEVPTEAPSAPLAAPAPRAPTVISRRAAFELREVTLTIEDVDMKRDFAEVLTRTGAALVVNGGFFGQHTEPLGLVISGGKKVSVFSPSMSGGVLFVTGDVGRLSATEDYKSGPADFAIQCRPRLVVGSHANIRSDDGKRAARTALCLRKAGQTLEFILASEEKNGGPTLFELATELAGDGCEEALNLDGGPSTGWASRGDGGLYVAPPQAGVRHVIVVRRRSDLDH